MTTLDNPNNFIDPSSVSPYHVALKYGGIVGLVLAILGLVLYLTGISDPADQNSAANSGISCLNYIVMIIGVVLAIKYHRDEELGGYLSYGRGVAVGTLTGLVMGIIGAVWTVIFMTLIAPDMSEAIMDAALENAQQGQEELTEKMVGIFTNPFSMAGLIVFFSVLLGLITSLIASAVLKKEPPVVL